MMNFCFFKRKDLSKRSLKAVKWRAQDLLRRERLEKLPKAKTQEMSNKERSKKCKTRDSKR